MKNVLADGSWTQRGGGLWVPPGRAGTAARLCRSGVPCCTLQPPTFPMPGRAWGKCVVCAGQVQQIEGVRVESRGGGRAGTRPARRGVHVWAVGAAGPVQQPEQTR